MKRKMLVCTSAVMITAMAVAAPAFCEEEKEFTVGICNYVDDASLNQIVDNIQSRLDEIGEEEGVVFNVDYDNCNADAAVMDQIITQFEADNVDLMVGVATPVAMSMQAATEDSQTPVVFAAVSDPLSSGFVNSLEVPGGNLTGTSDYLDTNAVLNLVLAQNPNTKKIGLLDDLQQEASDTALQAAKAFCQEKGIDILEITVSNAEEADLAVQYLAAEGVDAVFTPTDNTLMDSEYEIYQTFIDTGLPHFGGADGFALNGAFVGYGVDYGLLGIKTADMAVDILLNGKDPATMPVEVLDNNIATINIGTCRSLGYDLESVEAAFQPYCSEIKEVTTAEDADAFNGALDGLYFS